jgi:hypothetical protein
MARAKRGPNFCRHVKMKCCQNFYCLPVLIDSRAHHFQLFIDAEGLLCRAVGRRGATSEGHGFESYSF